MHRHNTSEHATAHSVLCRCTVVCAFFVKQFYLHVVGSKLKHWLVMEIGVTGQMEQTKKTYSVLLLCQGHYELI